MEGVTEVFAQVYFHIYGITFCCRSDTVLKTVKKTIKLEFCIKNVTEYWPATSL